MLPKCLTKIMERYYFIQQIMRGKTLSAKQKDTLVKKLILAYNTLDPLEKVDVLIPAKGEFLSDRALSRTKATAKTGKKIHVYSFRYCWGRFSGDIDGFSDQPTPIALLPGEEYDRIGASTGKYLSPILQSRVATYLDRAIPYYFPEKDIKDNPSYHRFQVTREIPDVAMSMPTDVPTENNARKSFPFPLRGTIAHAFWTNPDDGGGIQVKLPKSISSYRGAINEIRNS